MYCNIILSKYNKQKKTRYFPLNRLQSAVKNHIKIKKSDTKLKIILFACC